MSALAALYEELRQAALAGTGGAQSARGAGSALIVHRGLTAWIRAWARHASHCPATPERRPREDAPSSLVQNELTTILAAMVLAACAEVSA